MTQIAARRGSPTPPRGQGRAARWVPAAYLTLVMGLLAGAPSAWAQGATGSIHGQIIAQGDTNPVFGARITLIGTAKSATTDSAGRFVFDGLSAGLYVVQVNAIGYSRGMFQLQLGEGEAMSRVFELEPRVYGLEPMTVEGRRRLQGRRFEEFRQRMARGMGTFITKEDIQKRNPSKLMDVLRTVRGVRAECAGADCVVKFQGQPTSCEPHYILDGLPSDSYIAQSLDPRDVEGIELYRGASEMPAEFGGIDAACGVIAIWTKSGP
jgi:hypothetical protein